jgi:hypothetical protein
MSSKELTIKKYLSQLLLLVVSLLIILSVTSCGCDHSSKPDQDKGEDLSTEQINMSKKVVNIDVQLRIAKLAFDPANSVIIYNIQNDGKKAAEGVQLRYTNISQDNAEKEVVLNNQQEGSIRFTSIAVGGSTGDQTLPIDFKLATKAKFRFEVFCQDKPVKNAMKEEGFNKFPSLKLIPMGSTKLIGENKEIQFRIEKGDQSGNIDLSKLRLLVTEITGSSAKIYYEGKEVTEMLSGKYEASLINKDIRLYIEPGISLQASFDLQLNYEDEKMGNAQTFTWKLGGSEATKALLEAVRMGNEKRVKELLHLPEINVNIADKDGNTPLHLAVKKGNKEIVEILLKADNIELEFKNKPFGHTPLHEAIHQGNLGIIAALISQGANVNAASEMFNETPLYLAVIIGNQAATEALLTVKDIDVNIANNQGNTPLHTAVSRGDEVFVQLLLVKGAQKDIKNKKGRSPMDLAQESVNVEIKRLFGITTA